MWIGRHVLPIICRSLLLPDNNLKGLVWYGQGAYCFAGIVVIPLVHIYFPYLSSLCSASMACVKMMMQLMVVVITYVASCVLNSLTALAGLPVFPSFDWRFNEFSNSASHALYSTCIELMALPASGADIGNALYDIVLKGWEDFLCNIHRVNT